MQNTGEARNVTNHMMIFLKLALLAFCVMFFKYYNSGNYKEDLKALNITTQTSQEVAKDEPDKLKNKSLSLKSQIRHIIKQPTCEKEDKLALLNRVCSELELKSTRCRPEDVHDPKKHKIPKHYLHAKNTSNNETQGSAVINYLIGALLIASIGAALLELYRAKAAQNHPPNGDRKGLKVPSNRKCSLADLTVLKHHRKELSRRESVMEHAREEAREELSLKQVSRSPPPLLRRCSVPVGLKPIPETGSLSRRTSIVDVGAGLGRKLSILTDVNGMPMTSGEALLRRSSIAIDDAEKKHHSRLVHRH